MWYIYLTLWFEVLNRFSDFTLWYMHGRCNDWTAGGGKGAVVHSSLQIKINEMCFYVLSAVRVKVEVSGTVFLRNLAIISS
jgi:hypothetical protein